MFLTLSFFLSFSCASAQFSVLVQYTRSSSTRPSEGYLSESSREKSPAGPGLRERPRFGTKHGARLSSPAHLCRQDSFPTTAMSRFSFAMRSNRKLLRSPFGAGRSSSRIGARATRSSGSGTSSAPSSSPRVPGFSAATRSAPSATDSD